MLCQQVKCFSAQNYRCCCATRTKCVFCLGMKTVPAGLQHVFLCFGNTDVAAYMAIGLQTVFLFNGIKQNCCASWTMTCVSLLRKYRCCCIYGHRTTNSVSLQRNKTKLLCQLDYDMCFSASEIQMLLHIWP